MNRRGQFYLIAAIVIISIVSGLAIISNYSSSQPNSGISYLKDEISIESIKVINYGIYNHYSFTQMQNTLTDLSERYINESENDNLYFIFGNSTSMNFISYQAGYSNVTINGADYTDLVGTSKIYSQTFQPGNNVIISINGNQYLFNLNPGENFNFIISNNAGGQNYTVTNNAY